MNLWLLKTEAETFSIDDLAKVKREPWSGVRNFVARNHLKAMKIGDQCFIYHTGKEKQIVGLAKVVSKPYADPTQFDKKSPYFDAKSKKEKPPWWLVDVSFVRKLKMPVPLSEIKLDPKLSGMILLHAPRLSVQSVSEAHFRHILTL